MEWKYWDVAIAVFGFLVQCGLALLGLTLTHWKHKLAFAGLVVLGLGVTIWAVTRGMASAARIQTQLDAIQHNTEHPVFPAPAPPNPPPKQKAIMGLPDDAIKFDHDPKHGWWVNVECRNLGPNVVAKNVICGAYTEKVPVSGGAPTKKTLRETWDKFSKLVLHPAQYVDLEPGKGIWGSFGLDMIDIDPALTSGDKVIVVTGAMSYSDDAGKHRKEYCRWSQPPFNPSMTVWHFCEIGHNEQVY